MHGRLRERMRAAVRSGSGLACLMVCGAALWATAVRADPVRASAGTDSAGTPSRPRIGLALSGGGALGLAHVGVLEALEEAGIPVDAIAGISIGAVVGGLYAAGCSISELKEIAHRPELFRSPDAYANLSAYQKHLLRPRTFGLYLSGWEYRLPRSFVNDFNLNWMLIENAAPAQLACGGDFDRLPIPFRTVALDLRSRNLVVLRSGDLARAIRSSMSVPLAFPPIPARHPDRLLVDPGPVENLPVALAREMGCDRVIAVNCAARVETMAAIKTDPYHVAEAMLQVLSNPTDSVSVCGWDAWIEPALAGRRMTDFSVPDSLFAAGYRAAWAQMPLIRSWFGEPPSPAPHRTRKDLLDHLKAARVGWVRLGETPSSYVWVVQRELHLERGGDFSLPGLGRGLRRLYGTDHYDSVWPSLTADTSGVGILLDLEERAPTVLSFGLLYDNARSMNLDFELRRDNLLRLGETLYGGFAVGEFRNGLVAGVRSSRLRGVPVGLSLCLRTERDDYEQENAGKFRRTGNAAELSATFPNGRSVVAVAGLAVRRDRGEGAVGLAGWNHLSRTASLRLFYDDSDDPVLPAYGRQLSVGSEVFLEDLASVVHRYTASGSWSLPAGRFSLTPAAEVSGLNRRAPGFRLEHRLDLTRATSGRFERALYAPTTFAGSLTGCFGVASNLRLWMRGTAGLRGADLAGLRNTRPSRGLESGVLQSTAIGPLLAGMAWEKRRLPSVFIQVGHDIPALP